MTNGPILRGYMPNFKRKTAYLYGEIIKSGSGPLLKLNIKPNPVITIFPYSYYINRTNYHNRGRIK